MHYPVPVVIHRLTLLGEEQPLDISCVQHPVPILLLHIPDPHYEDLPQCSHLQAHKTNGFPKGLGLAVAFWLECCEMDSHGELGVLTRAKS